MMGAPVSDKDVTTITIGELKEIAQGSYNDGRDEAYRNSPPLKDMVWVEKELHDRPSQWQSGPYGVYWGDGPTGLGCWLLIASGDGFNWRASYSFDWPEDAKAAAQKHRDDLYKWCWEQRL